MASSSNSSEDDFSFPATTTDSPPHFIDSPPLWRTTPNSPTSHIENTCKEKAVENGHQRSFSLTSSQELYKTSNITIEERKCFSSCDDGYDEEEKMDMLWEDLNEEFSRNCGKKVKTSDVPSPGRDVRVSCVKAIKLSRPNGRMLSGKKPNILVFIKVLKKFFVLHNNSRRSIKKHAW